jgi:hypothetical protein
VGGKLKPDVKAAAVVAWLKADFGLGHGRAIATVALLKGRRAIARRYPDVTDDPRPVSAFNSQFSPLFMSLVR